MSTWNLVFGLVIGFPFGHNVELIVTKALITNDLTGANCLAPRSFVSQIDLFLALWISNKTVLAAQMLNYNGSHDRSV